MAKSIMVTGGAGMIGSNLVKRLVIALGLTIASGCTLSCPLASSTLGMSMVVGYKFNDYFKHNIWLDILCYIAVIILIPAFYGLTV